MKNSYAFGWLRDIPDQRDFSYAAPVGVLARLPERVDMRGFCPEVYDQGKLGSCTANAIGGALQFLQMKQGQEGFVPARLYIYYNERAIMGTIDSDSGAQLRDGVKVVNRWGACREKLWPYVIGRFSLKPGDGCYAEGLQHQALQYQRVQQNLGQMKGCLASGFPFVFGFVVYESMLEPGVKKSGEVPMPGMNEQPLGGHAVMAVGYDEGKRVFWVRNSWGAKWGRQGYGSLPYAYLADPTLSADFWTIRLVE